MKLTLIVGTPDSGKSSLAERLVCEVSKENSRYYVATMIPYGEDGKKRIEKHRCLREGKSFVTIEMPFDIDKSVEKISNPKEAIVLLECISNLVANEMFERHSAREDIPTIVAYQVKNLLTQVKELFVVTNEFEFEDSNDEETREYIRCISEVNKKLTSMADEVIEVSNEHI